MEANKINKFALIGAAGFVAPRHMEAIKKNHGQLLAALDPNDSVGVLDAYFPESDFFTSFERFERHIAKIQRQNTLDYISICSPNHHHDTHCRFSLQNGCNAICEKPLVLNPWNLELLQKSEEETQKKIFNILQLRLHPAIVKLKSEVDANPQRRMDIDLNYITSRGPWYHISWKGDTEKSGGISSNIGIHFFDMLMWIFGSCDKNIVHVSNNTHAAGYLSLKNANVRWFLSVDANHLPKACQDQKQRTFRSLKIDNHDIEFSQGFENLHIESYKHILAGNGFRTEEVAGVTKLAYDIRNQKPIGLKGDYHPQLNVI